MTKCQVTRFRGSQMTTPTLHSAPAFDALQGLSVGDALGAIDSYDLTHAFAWRHD